MAFAPDYVTSGLFYVYYTQQTPDLGAITIDEYRRSDANPDLADPSSRRERPARFHHPRGESQRRPAPVRPRRLPLHRHRRRRRRRRSRPRRPEPQRPAREDPPHRPARGGRRRVHDSAGQPVLQPAAEARRDLVVRPAQSLAVLLRPADRRPHDRRRGPERLGGDRLQPAGFGLRPRDELRLELPRGRDTTSTRASRSASGRRRRFSPSPSGSTRTRGASTPAARSRAAT